MQSEETRLLGSRDFEPGGSKVIPRPLPQHPPHGLGLLVQSSFLFRDVRCNWGVRGREKLLLGT